MSMRLGPWLKQQRRELVFAAICGGCRMTKDVRKATGLSDSAVATALAHLKRDGLIWRPPSGWKVKEAPTQER